ncbi:TPA: fimbrial protein [Klebsiella quasipneumoniae]|nr:fimbrial protein [Klebsiella quasipneumoniae]
MLKKNIFISCGLLLASYSFSSYAADNCIIWKSSYTITRSVIYIDPDSDVGSVLATADVNTSGAKASCLLNTKSGKYASVMKSPFNIVVGTNDKGDIYQSGIPGIGLQISDLLRRTNMVPYENTIRYQDLMPWETTGRTTVYFIKTGPISTGTTLNGIVAEYSLDKKTVATVALSANIAWLKKSCTVEPSKRNQTVIMPSTSSTLFGAIGSVGPQKEFSVSLVCEEDTSPVYVTFEATTGSSGDGILNIDNSVSGAASGVAIEILNKGDLSPLKFLTEVEYHKNKETSISIPFIARYKKIADAVSPGVANAAMTFTINQY